jgi:hypothetical protein
MKFGINQHIELDPRSSNLDTYLILGCINRMHHIAPLNE